MIRHIVRPTAISFRSTAKIKMQKIKNYQNATGLIMNELYKTLSKEGDNCMQSYGCLHGSSIGLKVFETVIGAMCTAQVHPQQIARVVTMTETVFSKLALIHAPRSKTVPVTLYCRYL